MLINFSQELPNLLYIAKGVFVTLKYSLISVFFGFILGSIIALGKTSKLRIIVLSCNFYTSIFRGTPLLIQLIIFYNVFPKLCGINLSIFAAGILAFSLNSAAYVSEIIRAGIDSIDKGQIDAAKALNIKSYNIQKDIVMPQAIRVILPSLINELVNMLKETAIISILGELDLMKRAQIISSQTYDYVSPMLMVGLCYYVMVLVFSKIAVLVENKLKL